MPGGRVERCRRHVVARRGGGVGNRGGGGRSGRRGSAGVLLRLRGRRGAGIGERPTLKFSLLGIDAGVTAATPSGVTYASFKTPLVMTEANVAEFLMGCTYALQCSHLMRGGWFMSLCASSFL